MRTPEKREVILPIDGWQKHTLYEVEVAYTACNVIHRALLYYDNSVRKQIWNPSYEEPKYLGQVYYLRVIRALDVML